MKSGLRGIIVLAVVRGAVDMRLKKQRTGFGMSTPITVAVLMGLLLVPNPGYALDDGEGLQRNLSREEAIRLATEYVEEKGLLPEGAVFVGAHERDDMVGFWYVYWEHRVDGIKVAGDHVSVVVGPGGVVGYSEDWSDITQVPRESLISEEEAVEIATRMLVSREYYRKLIDLSDVNVELKFVPVNRYWSDNPVTLPEDKRLCYSVEVAFPGGKAWVWVDARTGEIIGGDQTRDVGFLRSLIGIIMVTVPIGVAGFLLYRRYWSAG